MNRITHDYSILDDFKFDRKPVGVKFLLNKPRDLEQTDKSMPICRFLTEAQNSPPFYATKDNFSCVDRLVLGMIDSEPTTVSGQIGAKEKIYQEARANSRIYKYVEKIPKDTVRYVAFASYDKLNFSPDLLIFTVKPFDAEIIFRVIIYSIGKPIKSIITPVLMCAWLFSYPFVTGELNYSVTGIGYGMRMQKVLPEGLFVISIPYDIIPMLLNNLREMDWELPMTLLSEEERKEFSPKIMEEIKQEYMNS